VEDADKVAAHCTAAKHTRACRHVSVSRNAPLETRTRCDAGVQATHSGQGTAPTPPEQHTQPLFISNTSSCTCMTSASSMPTWQRVLCVFKRSVRCTACEQLPRTTGTPTAPHLAKLVLHDGDLLAVLLCQDAVDQRRLACADSEGGELQRGGRRLPAVSGPQRGRHVLISTGLTRTFKIHHNCPPHLTPGSR
jgi:hypothetical protein